MTYFFFNYFKPYYKKTFVRKKTIKVNIYVCEINKCLSDVINSDIYPFINQFNQICSFFIY